MPRTIAEIQAELRKRGFDPGPLGRNGKEDGILGRRTRGALERFQVAYDLHMTGRPDDATVRALFLGQPGPRRAEPLASSAPWFLEALRLLGTREVAGTSNSAIIMGWAKAIAARAGKWIEKVYTGDDVPWCGLFVGHCIAAALPREALPSNPLGARAWLNFGREITTPVPGAVVVLWRGKPTGGQGHVGFYAGESRDGKILVLGGNQGDTVSRAWFPKERLLGYRWPTTVELPSSVPVVISETGGPLSKSEA